MASYSVASHHVNALLTELTELPYWVFASCLNAKDACQLDASCNRLKALNSTFGWRALGARAYVGIELEQAGGFEQTAFFPLWMIRSIDWKKRYRQFQRQILQFMMFDNTGITKIMGYKIKGEAVRCRCQLLTKTLRVQAEANSIDLRSATCTVQSPEAEVSVKGVYLEVEVIETVKHLSLLITDSNKGKRPTKQIEFQADLGVVFSRSVAQDSSQTYIGPRTGSSFLAL